MQRKMKDLVDSLRNLQEFCNKNTVYQEALQVPLYGTLFFPQLGNVNIEKLYK